MESSIKSKSVIPRRLREASARLAQPRAPFIVAFASVCLCAAGLALGIGPWQLWVGAELLYVVAIAFNNIPAAVGILIAISPYNSAIRWVAGEGAFIRGVRDVISYVIFAVFLQRYGDRTKQRTHSTIALFFVCWCVLVQILNSSGLLAGVLGLRELVQFFLLFPVVVALVSEEDRSSAEGLLGVIVLTAGVMSFVQLANYFGIIHLPLPESEELVRRYGEQEILRMIPIVEISPSGLAVYMVSASMIVIARFMETRQVPWFWVPCLAGALSCTWLSMSHSGVVALLVGLGVIAFCGKRPGLSFILLVVVFVASFPILFGETSFTEKNTAEYSKVLVSGWQSDLNTAFAHPVFGMGASPAGYLAGVLESEFQTIGDGGWALLACQVGIPVAALMFGWAVSIMGIAAWNLKTEATAPASSGRWVPLGALAAAVVYFVNAHGVPWYRVGADVNFVVLAGILVALGQPKLLGSAKPLRKVPRSVLNGRVPAAVAAAGGPKEGTRTPEIG
jgi:hypothetical protein